MPNLFRQIRFCDGSYYTRLLAVWVAVGFVCSSSSTALWQETGTQVPSSQQDDESNPSEDQQIETEEPVNPAAPGLSDSASFVWQFGIETTATGAATGILATAPIPVEWPEQTVEIIDEEKTENVGRISVKKLNGEARQMVVRINRLNSGETARAVLQVRITRSSLTAPEQTGLLTIPRSPGSKLRKFLRPSPMIESNDERIEEIAATIALDETLTDWQKVEAIYNWVRENIEYEFANENFSCLETLDKGIGDCGELTALFVALCRAKEIPARSVWIPGHAYPEFYLEDADGNGFWFPCQVAGEYEFGAMSETRPVLQKGDSFKLPGMSEPTRFIQPTLVAKDAAGGLDFQHITQEIEFADQPDSESSPRRSLMNRDEEGEPGVPDEDNAMDADSADHSDG